VGLPGWVLSTGGRWRVSVSRSRARSYRTSPPLEEASILCQVQRSFVARMRAEPVKDMVLRSNSPQPAALSQAAYSACV
jgi:hypothetical protein